MNASSSPDETWPEICADARVYLRSLTALPGIANSANQFELIAVAAGQETRTRLDRADLVDGAGPTGKAREQHISALLAHIEAARGDVCGLGMERPRIMGVLNVTPDSFSDGGKNFDCGTAIAAAMTGSAIDDLAKWGRTLLDAGYTASDPGSIGKTERARSPRRTSCG